MRHPGDGRIRVLQLVARLNVGGPAELILALADGLDPDRFAVTVAAGDVAGGELDHRRLRDDAVPVTRIPGLGRRVSPARDAAALQAIARLARRLRPHIVHTHTAKAGMLGRLAGRAAPGARYVHTFHGHVLHGYFSPARSAGVREAERALARVTDQVIAVGDAVRDELIAAGIATPARTRVILPGIAVGQVPARTAAREALGLSDDAPLIACVGRLAPVKRVDRVLEVVAALRAQGTPVIALIAGGGEAERELRAQAAPLGDAIRFLGWRGDTATLYAAADVVVLTSDNEGAPLSLMEAAACGRPVVATRVGGVADVVAHDRTGLLVPPGDVPAFSAAVARLLAEPGTAARLGTAAAQGAGRFGRARMVAEHADVYAEMLTRPRRRTSSRTAGMVYAEMLTRPRKRTSSRTAGMAAAR